MQIKTFTIPIVGGTAAEAELNKFLRGQKVLQVLKQLVCGPQGNHWCFCVEYVAGALPKPPRSQDRKRKDYRAELDPTQLARFERMRTIRKQLAQAESIPAYAVFTDKELELEKLEAKTMRSVLILGTNDKVGVVDFVPDFLPNRMLFFVLLQRTKKQGCIHFLTLHNAPKPKSFKLAFIPVTKWFGNFSLASAALDFPAKPRRSLGCVYVLRVAENIAGGAIIFPSHSVPGIAAVRC